MNIVKYELAFLFTWDN